tara:strand:+ start:324 stop:485 length:162 start_codon:yes stop_codon:yes gene_type:complete
VVFDSLINAHWPTELLALCYVGNGQIKKSLGYAQPLGCRCPSAPVEKYVNRNW